MIKDITFGQYFPADSFIHKLDPRTKMLLLIAYIVFCFICNNVVSLGVFFVLLVFIMALSKISLKLYLKNIKAILPIVILTAVLNLFYMRTGVVLVSFWKLVITDEGVLRAGFMAIRIIMLILSSAVFSYTTTPTSITNAIESLLKPLSFIGLKSAVQNMAMIMTIALRFIPTLIEETDKLINAQKARGADMESGGIIKRVKSMLPILIPLIISSFRRAYDLAESMECRCFGCSSDRTKYAVMKYKAIDFVSFGFFAVFGVTVIVLNKIF